MTALQRIQQVSLLFGKYGALAAAAVAQVQTEVGASNGDSGLQVTKKQLAVAYVIAAAHAGESVPNTTVQTVATLVDLVAGTAKALGLFGKTASAGAVTAPVLVSAAAA